MHWDIQPLVSLGPIKIGMKRAEVCKLLDPIESVTAFNAEADGSHREFRGLSMPIVSYRGGSVIGIDTNRHVSDVTFRTLNVYQVTSVHLLQELERENGGAAEAGGLIVFDNLSISCSGFYLTKEAAVFRTGSGDQDDRGIGVFEKGAFNPYHSMMSHLKCL